MRWILSLALMPALFAVSPELRNVKSVYLLPMSNGFDQYLANQIQSSSLYVVVADPQAADAVITDALGPAFEKKMADLYPAPKPEEEEADADDIKGNDAVPKSRFGRGRGMVFVVERKSKQVVWSTYELPKNFRPDTLDQAARRVTGRLKKELNGQVASK